MILSPFSFDKINNNYGVLKDSSMRLFSLSIEHQKNKVSLNQFSLIEVEKLSPNEIRLPGKSNVALRGGLGIKEAGRHITVTINAGVGCSVNQGFGFFI